MEIDVENAVRFTLENEEVIYIVVPVEEGNNIVKKVYENEKVDLSEYAEKTVFYPGIEDKEFVEDVIQSVFN